MAADKGNRKDKNQNIQVFVRLRPINQRERDIRSMGVVEVQNNREVVVRLSAQTTHTKKFTFDRAFGPSAKQVEVYQEVVSPLIEEVLLGYNCTVFAYGQTGTGKTHTMIGESTDAQSTWQNDPDAGIVPRVLNQLFDELRLSNTEYTVRVSYLELYNEELFDLLSTSEDNSKLRIYEDVTRKGSNIVNGLEEVTVYSKKEVYKILAQGQERKKVATTYMNAQSSRSHTVFTIVVHMKENSPEGEELVKIGKLNLVDLAGSENINKAGTEAKKERTRECVNINQSLLTLGRVITALVERHPHIPYRESKLTRILQESLGGRTKTSIIATISPGHKDLEETLSTLEYAHRAKNIQNKPEINQKMTKKAILKEFVEEIDRLKRDLQAARDKNGVYLANETYTEMTLKAEEQNKEIQNLILQKRAMEEAKDKMEAVFKELNQTIQEKEFKLKTTQNNLEIVRERLYETKTKLEKTSQECDEQQHLVSKHCETEVALNQQANALLETADLATNHVETLQDTVDKRKNVEKSNAQVTQSLREESRALRENIIAHVSRHSNNISHCVDELTQLQEKHNLCSIECQKENVGKIDSLVQINVDALNEVKMQTSKAELELNTKTQASKQCFERELRDHCDSLEKLLKGFVESLGESVANISNIDVKGREIMNKFVQQWYAGGCSQVQAIKAVHGKYLAQVNEKAALAKAHIDNVSETQKQLADARSSCLQLYLEEIERERQMLEERLAVKLREVEIERHHTEERLERWAEEERRSLEERLTKHLAEEKEALEERLSKKLQSIEEERGILEEKMSNFKLWGENQMLEVWKEVELADMIVEEHKNQSDGSLQCLNKYDKEFCDGASRLSIDMEAFSNSIMDVVAHNHEQILQGVTTTHDNVTKEVAEVIAADRECSLKLQNTSDSLFQHVIDTNKNAANALISNIELYNNNSTDKLSSISSSLSTNVSVSLEHDEHVRGLLAATADNAAEFKRTVENDICSYSEIENKLLGQDYKIYSPTGKTPMRQTYRYPRILPATSPHERILEKYRASRIQHSCDDDVIILESDGTPVSSDNESSIASEHAFAAPTPLTNGHALAKSTSETEIYVRRSGKENTDVSRETGSNRKSKLPAPFLKKPPLAERGNSLN